MTALRRVVDLQTANNRAKEQIGVLRRKCDALRKLYACFMERDQIVLGGKAMRLLQSWCSRVMAAFGAMMGRITVLYPWTLRAMTVSVI